MAAKMDVVVSEATTLNLTIFINSLLQQNIANMILSDVQNSSLELFIEYTTSAGHHKNMYTYRNEKKDTKHSGKKHIHIKTL